MCESSLPGGAVSGAVRVGATVRRAPPPRAAFVHRLLALFERHGWAGAPRFLGLDAQGRQILGHIAGLVPWQAGEQERVRHDDALAGVARLVRAFHDLTAGSPLAAAHEVVCHNDLAPRNTVYAPRGGAPLPVAFIDWDLAAPGDRVHDLAHVCWQYVDLGPRLTDVPEAARRMRLVCDAYGLADRSRLLDTVLWWQRRSRLGIRAAAEAGDPAMLRLRARGAVEEIGAAYAWVSAHRAELAAALR